LNTLPKVPTTRAGAEGARLAGAVPASVEHAVRVSASAAAARCGRMFLAFCMVTLVEEEADGADAR
jgi:hypothetical protein